MFRYFPNPGAGRYRIFEDDTAEIQGIVAPYGWKQAKDPRTETTPASDWESQTNTIEVQAYNEAVEAQQRS